MKPSVIRTTKGNVKTLAPLKAVLRSGYWVKLNAFQRQQRSLSHPPWMLPPDLKTTSAFLHHRW